MIIRRTLFRGPLMVLCLLCLATISHAASLGDTLRTLAAQAAISNPITTAPLRPAPAWVANTAYEMGVVVVHGGKLYLCRSSGTSASSGGPSGTGSPGMFADINDGSAKWEYYGPPVTTVADATAPVATSLVSPPGDLTTYVSPWTGSAPAVTKYFFTGGTPTLNPNQPGTQLSFPSVTINGSGTGGNVGLNNGYSNYHWSATFVTDAPKLALGVNYAPTPVNIIVDGRRLFPGGWQGVSGGNPSHFILDFTAAGGRKPRTITIEDYGNISFAGVWIDAASTLSAPTITTPIRVAVFGSSIECGGNSFPSRGDLGWPAQVAKLLGWHEARNLGLGGTGYINNQGGSTLTYAQHLSDATSMAPNLVVVGGPINDSTQPVNDLKNAAVAFLGQLRTALPNAPIIALGTFPAASGPSALSIASENAIAAAVQQLADPRIFFIPLCTAPAGSFISGTGNVGFNTGSGNADLYISNDGTHPDQPGIDFIAVYYASRIKALVINQLDVAPTITSFTPTSGMAGTLVVITGNGFTGVTGVTIGGVAATYTVGSAESLTVTVPGGVTSGAIVVTTPNGSATSATTYGGSGGGSAGGDGGSDSGGGCGLGSGAAVLMGLLMQAVRSLLRSGRVRE